MFLRKNSTQAPDFYNNLSNRHLDSSKDSIDEDEIDGSFYGDEAKPNCKIPIQTKKLLFIKDFKKDEVTIPINSNKWQNFYSHFMEKAIKPKSVSLKEFEFRINSILNTYDMRKDIVIKKDCRDKLNLDEINNRDKTNFVPVVMETYKTFHKGNNNINEKHNRINRPKQLTTSYKNNNKDLHKILNTPTTTEGSVNTLDNTKDQIHNPPKRIYSQNSIDFKDFSKIKVIPSFHSNHNSYDTYKNKTTPSTIPQSVENMKRLNFIPECPNENLMDNNDEDEIYILTDSNTKVPLNLSNKKNDSGELPSIEMFKYNNRFKKQSTNFNAGINIFYVLVVSKLLSDEKFLKNLNINSVFAEDAENMKHDIRTYEKELIKINGVLNIKECIILKNYLFR